MIHRATAIAILEAAESPELIQNATSCRYVTYLNDGTIKHCIVGQVLSNLDMDDATLISTGIKPTRDLNSTTIDQRDDLHAFIRDHDLDLNTLDQAQIAFDGEINFPQYLVELREAI